MSTEDDPFAAYLPPPRELGGMVLGNDYRVTELATRLGYFEKKVHSLEEALEDLQEKVADLG